MSIVANIQSIQQAIPDRVTLIAVSKTVSEDVILQTYESGHHDFGENRVMDLIRKAQKLPKDIRWHFIGHLQRNKVRQVLPYTHLIHSIDSLNLLKEVDQEAKKLGKKMDVLLQFQIAEEETKFGLDIQEAIELLESQGFKNMMHVRIRGVMGMATLTDDENRIRKEFRQLHQIFSTIRDRFFRKEDTFNEISMGMSGDYLLALEEGSTMIRIGTAIFN